MLRRTMLLSVIPLLGACQPEASSTAPLASSGKTQLLFFLDPQGGPCQFQQQILGGMGDSLTSKVALRPVSSREGADRPLFSAYGIRALPTLVLADAQGKELRRLPPGIQSAETIISFLQAQGVQ